HAREESAGRSGWGGARAGESDRQRRRRSGDRCERHRRQRAGHERGRRPRAARRALQRQPIGPRPPANADRIDPPYGLRLTMEEIPKTGFWSRLGRDLRRAREKEWQRPADLDRLEWWQLREQARRRLR